MIVTPAECLASVVAGILSGVIFFFLFSKLHLQKALQEIAGARADFQNAKIDDERQKTLLVLGRLTSITSFKFGASLILVLLPLLVEFYVYQFEFMNMIVQSIIFTIAFLLAVKTAQRLRSSPSSRPIE